jgi:hypothetical protein
VQCKDWNSSVKQEQVFALKTVLEDLPKQPRGIIVTKKGFQKGSKGFATHHGIKLFELKEEGEQISITLDSFLFQLTYGSFVNLEVSLEEQCLKTTVYTVKCTEPKIHLNDSWVKRKIKILGNDAVSNALKDIPNLNQNLFNANYQQIETAGQILLNDIESIQEEAKLKLKVDEIYKKDLNHNFTSPTYFSTKAPFLQYIRIQSIGLNVEITQKTPYQIPFVKTGITTFILRNIIDGNEKKFEIPIQK